MTTEPTLQSEKLEPCPLPEPLRTLAQECCDMCLTGTVNNGYGVCDVTPPRRSHDPSQHAMNWTHDLARGGCGYGCSASALYELNSRAPVVVPQGDAPLFEAKLLGFGEGDRINLCEPCLRRAINDHLVSFSSALPAAPASPSPAEGILEGRARAYAEAEAERLARWGERDANAAHGKEDKCAWTLDGSNDGDVWETGCGETFQFTDGGPTENHFTYCYRCGKRIDAARYSDFASVGEEGK